VRLRGGKLHYDTTTLGNSVHWSVNSWDGDEGKRFTVELAVQVHSIVGCGVPYGVIGIPEALKICVGAGPGQAGTLVIEADKTWWYIQDTKIHKYVLSYADNCDRPHAFRIAREGNEFHIWRDGVEIGRYFPGYYAQNGLSFGSMNGASGGSVDIDYVRWDLTGAYAPPAGPQSNSAAEWAKQLSTGNTATVPRTLPQVDHGVSSPP
jgi:hypothetical protein